MDISTIGGIAASGAAGASARIMGKEDFLALLVAQLRHQDPLSPMDNSEFVAQLAQFSSLEQMQNLNTAVADQGLLMQALNNSVVASLAGRTVAVSGDRLPLPETGEAALGFDLAAPAREATVRIYDASGALVDSFTLTDLSAGPQRLAWDGVGSDGERLPAGTYRSEVSAADAEGAAVSAVPYVIGRVDSVSFENGVAYLSLSGMRVPLAALREVLADGALAPAE